MCPKKGLETGCGMFIGRLPSLIPEEEGTKICFQGQQISPIKMHACLYIYIV